jgi:hypothetical protein
MHPIEVNPSNSVVRGVDCGGEIGSGCGDPENAAAGSAESVGILGCSGLEYGRAGGLGLIDAGDRFAGLVGAGVSAGGEDHTHARSGAPCESLAGEPAFGGRDQSGEEVGIHAVHQGLRFGVAEADVELENFRALACHHQTGVEKASELRAVDRREDDAVEDVAGLSTIQDAGVAIRAHASGIRAGVAFVDGFMVLRGSERNRIAAVAEGDEADLLAAQELLDDQSSLEEGERGFRFGAIVGDDDAFAGRQSICLKNDGVAESVERAAGVGGVVDSDVAGSRNLALYEEVLCENLAALELGCLGCGSDNAEAARPEAVDDAFDQRHFGTNHGEVGAERFGVVEG